MKRRGFLQVLGGASVLLAPIAHGLAESEIPPFVKQGAVHCHVNMDFSECALDEALSCLPHSARYALVVHPVSEMRAVRILDEIQRLRAQFPGNVPEVKLRLEPAFANENEWGLVADNGRCFWNPGA